MKAVAAFLLDNGVACAWRAGVGIGIAALIGIAVVVVAAVLSHKKKLLHVGAPYDPWPHRGSLALWIIVGIPAFAAAGALVGLGYAAAHIVETTQVTEKVAHGACTAVVGIIARDPQAASLVKDDVIRVDDIGAFLDRAPSTVGDSVEDHVEGITGHVAAAMVAWLAKSAAADRLKLVTPVVADMKARDTDGDGRVAVGDVVDSLVRIQLAPRAAAFAQDTVSSHALAPIVVVVAVFALPALLCAFVRSRRRAAVPA